MAYALLDNASLTAVERATGSIICNNADTVDGDLVAIENLIQAILFYDELICIDNYKENHKEAREKKFDYIKFISPQELGLNKVEEIAKKEASSILPEIRGGEFVDSDFKSLIEQLKLNIICTWDMRSSVYYLTLKMLGQPNTREYDKYSKLSAAIFNELSDVSETKGHWSTEVKLTSSNGHTYSKEEFKEKKNSLGGTTKPLEVFIASLNWIAYKSIYYNIAAKHLKADSFLHPIRHAYQLHWMKKTGAFGHDFTSRLITNLSNKARASIADITGQGQSQTISLDLPLFSAWLTNESGSIENAIIAARELKKKDHFVTARETLREIKAAYENNLQSGNTLTNKLIRDMDKISGDLKREYGVPSLQGIQGSFLIKAINTGTSIFGIPALPDKEFAINTPNFMKSNSTKAFSVIFKDITNELTSIERLGGLRDKMSASFCIDDHFSNSVKTEDPRFRHATSHWKIPM